MKYSGYKFYSHDKLSTECLTISHNRNFRFIDFKHTHSSLFADGISGRLDNISIVLDSQIYI